MQHTHGVSQRKKLHFRPAILSPSRLALLPGTPCLPLLLYDLCAHLSLCIHLVLLWICFRIRVRSLNLAALCFLPLVFAARLTFPLLPALPIAARISLLLVLVLL